MDPNERIEHLINRRLDGELTDEEGLELDRALIKSPEHRAMLELSERIDAMCAETILGAARGAVGDVDRVAKNAGASEKRVVQGGRSRGARWWWALPAALAACVGWLTIAAPSTLPPTAGGLQFVEGDPVSGASLDADVSVPTPGKSPLRVEEGKGRPSAIQQVSSRGRRLDRRRDTELLGVVGDDGRIYLIEVTRTQAYSRPSARSGVRLAAEGL